MAEPRDALRRLRRHAPRLRYRPTVSKHLHADCFENEPHYHYIEQANGTNTVVRIDELAVGDPVEFSLACVEHHLSAMLRHCGVADLADEVAGRPDRVQRGDRRGPRAHEEGPRPVA